MVSKLFKQQPPIIQVTPTDDSEGIRTGEESQEKLPRGSFNADKRPKKKELMTPPRERKRSSKLSRGSRLSKVSKASAARAKRRWSKKIWPTNAKFWSKIAGYNSRLGLPLLDEAPYNIHIRAMEKSPSAIESKYGHRFYEIFQQTGTKLYFAAEKSKYSGGSRPFELTFLDTSHNVMMTMLRKDSRMLCCCGAKCFGNNATIYDNQQNILGEIKQEWRCGVLRFNLNIPGLPDKKNIIIKGPDRHVCCLSYIGDDVTFEVFSTQKVELTGALEQTRIGIYRLYSTPAPFHDNPAVLRLETQMEPSTEFQGVLIAVGALLIQDSMRHLDKDRVTILAKKIRTRNQLLFEEAAAKNVPEEPREKASESSPGPRVPYPNVLSVSHSNVWSLPKGMDGLRDTPALYLESETALEDDRLSRFYNVVDAFGRYLYIAQECSYHHGSSRPFELKIVDDQGEHFLTLKRPNTWGLCCLGSKCKGNNATIYTGTGELMGHIKQAYWRQGLKFHISDATGSEIMRVKGPSNVSCLHPRIDKKTAVELYYVNLENSNEYVVGTFNVITQEKKTSGFVFGMQFPLDFTVEYKALVMSMGFLMNFTFCEIQPSACLNWYGSGMIIAVACIVTITLSVALVLVLTLHLELLK